MTPAKNAMDKKVTKEKKETTAVLKTDSAKKSGTAAPKAAAVKKTEVSKMETKKAETKTVSNTTKKAITEPKAAAAKKETAEPRATATKKATSPKAEKAAPKTVKKAATKDGKKKILFAASEVQPFAGTGGLGEVMGSLGKSIQSARADYEIRVVLPLYENVTQEMRKKFKYLKHINVQLSWRSQYCGIFEYDYDGVKYYFIDNEYYYKRPNLYGYYDDGERFAFFSKAVLDILPEVGFQPDIIHANDWQTALVPVYYKLYYIQREFFRNIKTVFTVHNVEYQGKFGKNIIEDVFGISYSEYSSLEHEGCVNLMKGAIDYSDIVTTVSPSYAQELLTDYYAHGLNKIFEKNSQKMRGILNGIDYDSYDPATDPALFTNYDVTNVDKGKAKNKAELQSMLNLPVDANVPVIAVVSRLVGHKGIDIIKFVLNEILDKNLQLIILGKGDADYENFFTYMQSQCPQRICTLIAFNKDLSRKIYAGSDFFLMPSKSEPCGLGQMIAGRYGTVPIVRETGGLKDSIIDAHNGDFGHGYTFSQYNAHDMLNAINRAIGLYTGFRDKFKALRKRLMEVDFSWKKSALEYIKLYDYILK